MECRRRPDVVRDAYGIAVETVTTAPEGPDVATVAAPGSSAYGDADDARGIMNALMAVRGFISEYETSIDDPEITGEDHRAIAADMLTSLTTAEGAVAKVAQFVKSIKSQTRAGEGDVSAFDPALEVDLTAHVLMIEACLGDLQRNGDVGQDGMRPAPRVAASTGDIVTIVSPAGEFDGRGRDRRRHSYAARTRDCAASKTPGPSQRASAHVVA